jgi:hypothetical protein
MQRSLSAPAFALSQPIFQSMPLPPPAEPWPAAAAGKARESPPPSKEPAPEFIDTPHKLRLLQQQVIWGLRVLAKNDWWLQFLTWEEADRAIAQNWAVITLLANMNKEERKRRFDNTKPTLVIVALVQLAVCLRNDDKDFIVMSVEAQQIYNATHIRDRLLEVKLQGPAEWKVYNDDGQLMWTMTPDVKSGRCDLDGSARNTVKGVDGDKLYPQEVYERKLRDYSELLREAVGLELPRAILEGCKPCILADGYEPSRRELVRREVAHRACQGRQYKEARNEERKAGFIERFGHAMHRHPCPRPTDSGASLAPLVDEEGLPLPWAKVLLPGEEEHDVQYDARLCEALAKHVPGGNESSKKQPPIARDDEFKERDARDDRLTKRLSEMRAAAKPESRGEDD